MIRLVLVAALIVAPRSDIALSGLVLTQDGNASAAILCAAGKTRVAGLGESVFGGRVAAIDVKGVELLFGEQRVRLHLTKKTATRQIHSLASTPIAPDAATDSTPPPAAPTLTLSRVDVDRRLSLELNRILAETALVPVTDEGRVVGVALRRIAQGSLLTDVGLRPGDVITELNGTAIDGIATLMTLYSRLQSATELNAVVLREGRPVSLNIKLR